MAKYLISAFLLVLLVVATFQFLKLNEQRKKLSQQIENEQEKLTTLKQENGRVLSEIEYFQNKENLEKEFKSRFNYRKPEEKMYILVP
jgi:cell division protein FtsB